MESGLIVKGIGGFYYVKLKSGDIYCCRAKGAFRKLNATPFVGDYVDIRIVSEEIKEGYIENIHERKNLIIRPPMANLDRLIMISSVLNPVPDTVFIDKMLAICEFHKIEPILCFNKLDLSQDAPIISDYEKIGYQVIKTSAKDDIGIAELKSVLKPGINAAAGFSGVGKSSLLNNIIENADAKTGCVSEKLLRGKHTTRHVELFQLSDETYFADTPGFSSLEIDQIRKEELSDLFIEFRPYLNQCQFQDCSHTKEKGCEIIAAIENGEILKSRHENYVNFYNVLKQIKDWERK